MSELDRFSALGQSTHVSLASADAGPPAFDIGLGRPDDILVYRCPATPLQGYTHLLLEADHLQGSTGTLEVTLGTTADRWVVLSADALPLVDSSTRRLLLPLPPAADLRQEMVSRVRFRLVDGRGVYLRLSRLALVVASPDTDE